MTSPTVGIIILNWKRPDEIIDCLASLRRQAYSSYEVVVVDNASNNGSVARIRHNFPDVVVLENSHNLGFAGGCNVGIGYLMSRGVDYVLLLNDDTEVAPDMLSILIAAAEQDPNIGIVGPSIFYFEPSDVLWSGGGSIDRYGTPHHLHVDERPDGTAVNSDVDYITGCGMLIKRRVFDTVGALDERFFAYFEETELCARARRAGLRVVYVPRARMWHKIGQNERGQSRAYLYLMARNRLLYVKCSDAPIGHLIVAALDLIRTAVSWSIRPSHRHMRPFATALTRGVFHFFTGQLGAPPARP